MSFVRLDFITVKSQLNVKTLLVFVVAALPLIVMTGDPTAGIGMGIILAMILVGHPFMVGEKSDMDAFYATLSLKKETVVAGRYLFTLALNLCGVLISFGLVLLGLLVAGMANIVVTRVTDTSVSVENIIWSFGPLVSLCIALQVIQLPLFFKFGYTKARLFIVVPFAIIEASLFVFAFVTMSGSLPAGVLAILTTLMTSDILLALFSVVLLPLLVFVSYRLSLSFYRKREF
jgi:hypothetical protein